MTQSSAMDVEAMRRSADLTGGHPGLQVSQIARGAHRAPEQVLGFAGLA